VQQHAKRVKKGCELNILEKEVFLRGGVGTKERINSSAKAEEEDGERHRKEKKSTMEEAGRKSTKHLSVTYGVPIPYREMNLGSQDAPRGKRKPRERKVSSLQASAVQLRARDKTAMFPRPEGGG